MREFINTLGCKTFEDMIDRAQEQEMSWSFG